MILLIKVKIIGNDIENKLEKEINKFIENKDIIDIKYTQSVQGEEYVYNYFSALIIYKEAYNS